MDNLGVVNETGINIKYIEYDYSKNETEIEIKDDYSKNEMEKIIDKFVEIMEKMK